MASKKIEVEITATDKASAKLEKVEKQADRIEADSIDLDITADTSALDRAKAKIGDLSSGMGGLSATMSGGIAGGATALAAGLFAAAQHTADMAIDAQVTASLTGATVEDASRLQTVWKQTGADVNDLNDILLNMNGVLAASPELAGQLHVNLNDGANGVDRLLELLEELNTSQLSANEKALIMGQLFGEEGVRQMGKLLALFPDLETAIEDVGDAQVITAEKVERAREFNTELGKMTQEGADLAAVFGSALVPIFTEFFGFLNTGITTFEDWGRAVRGFVDSGAAANFEITAAFEASEAAAADFDTELLNGLTSFDQVHAKVLELTGSYHAANVVATDWLHTIQGIGTATAQIPGNDPRMAAQGLGQTLGGGAQNILNGRAAPATMVVNNYLPPGGPVVTAEDLGTYRTRNSSRTNG